MDNYGILVPELSYSFICGAVIGEFEKHRVGDPRRIRDFAVLSKIGKLIVICSGGGAIAPSPTAQFDRVPSGRMAS